MLPTREDWTWSSVTLACRPDSPVIDDAALGTVDSCSLLLPTMGPTCVAGGVLLSAPKELRSEDIGSRSNSADRSLDVDRVGGGGEEMVADWALMDGTALLDFFCGVGGGAGAAGWGLNEVGTNSLAVARIVPMMLDSTYDAPVEALGSLFADDSGALPGRKPGGGTEELPPPPPPTG